MPFGALEHSVNAEVDQSQTGRNMHGVQFDGDAAAPPRVSVTASVEADRRGVHLLE
jgi:hypothetical protein